ncbi:uncharacterized protein PHALS_14521 [Plasmopara halstedii]|uniref:Uncharacterized protein n=1 Tax=Plasmopara halstedii TaxID=4781 RepID=A0A0P1AJ05_PLAHL|nr:uncharacterized protein PHALS_14521 [Plasmopara halstedii]CEG41293.1 hypothetical protein PHALS_14521 [Plasmopara halstedii]|eukprot:XP_024577662.1 hypothetical protein PHALS_14521 [Plasmopara halstedii]
MATTPFNNPILQNLRPLDAVDFVAVIEDALAVIREVPVAKSQRSGVGYCGHHTRERNSLKFGANFKSGAFGAKRNTCTEA